MKIIGISGKRESGKSSLAGFLEEMGCIRVSLASPLKELCMSSYGLTKDQVYGVFKEQPTHYRKSDGGFYTPRDILIKEGCLKREIDKDYWCKKLYASAVWQGMNQAAKKTFVIDDIRFKNEVAYFKERGAKFIRLERDCGKPDLDDPSEKELDNYKDWDALLLSKFNRNLDDLRKFAEYIVDAL